MAVIRTGKSRLVKAGVVGAVIVLVPTVIAGVIFAMNLTKKQKNLDEANELLGRYRIGTVCVLNKDMKQGQVIKSEDIKMVEGVFNEKGYNHKMEDYVGKVMKTSAKEGTILNEYVLQDEAKEGKDMRTYYIDYVEIPSNASSGMKFDIRICFPNGEDYLIATNKSINVRDEEGFYIDLTRYEALLLSSAKVDQIVYDGTKIYAVVYATGFEKDEVVTYPVNNYVFDLGQWEPNIIETFSEEMFNRRQTLEENLMDFMGVANKLQ
ncbi:MAG: SAF domain-containing protein [Lachnospiraceae bacterium]|nr:SAF domain-containing protein [Lachnospiraceae bacterium]